MTMRLKIEESFYSKRGTHMGERSIRMASQIELLVMELWVTQDTYARAAPLLESLRRRTLSRRRYEILVAIMTANALATGQPDESSALLEVMGRMWAKCPARYLPDLRPLRRKIRALLARVRREDPGP
jgi:hypothetical protein